MNKITKTFTCIVLALALIRCTNRDGQFDKKGDGVPDYGSGLSIVKIDSCEYVLFIGNNSGDVAMVHSGNCHNPKHHNP